MSSSKEPLQARINRVLRESARKNFLRKEEARKLIEEPKVAEMDEAELQEHLRRRFGVSSSGI